MRSQEHEYCLTASKVGKAEVTEHRIETKKMSLRFEGDIFLKPEIAIRPSTSI